MVILLEGDNKYKEGPFQDGELLGETGDWLDLGALDLDLTENTENTTTLRFLLIDLSVR